MAVSLVYTCPFGYYSRIHANTRTAPEPRSVNSVCINEIMFDPLPQPSGNGAEYVELLNTGPNPVAVAGWKLYDLTGKTQLTIPANTPPVPPGALLLLASDSSVFSRFAGLMDSVRAVISNTAGFGLNADRDLVLVKDAGGAVVDSVLYDAGWHRADLADSKGVSLERVSAGAASNSPATWSSCVAPRGGTPGAVNSLSIPAHTTQARLSLTPATVSPDADGRDDFVRIAYTLPAQTSRIVVTAYDRYGRYVCRIANYVLSGSDGELVWNAYDDLGRPLIVGLYVVRIDAYDEAGIGLLNAQAPLIVARKL